jgi:hypothetical protein
MAFDFETRHVVPASQRTLDSVIQKRSSSMRRTSVRVHSSVFLLERERVAAGEDRGDRRQAGGCTTENLAQARSPFRLSSLTARPALL